VGTQRLTCGQPSSQTPFPQASPKREHLTGNSRSEYGSGTIPMGHKIARPSLDRRSGRDWLAVSRTDGQLMARWPAVTMVLVEQDSCPRGGPRLAFAVWGTFAAAGQVAGGGRTIRKA
jgi:hypothetical protein